MTELQLMLTRIARRESYTIGRLFVDGGYVCDAIEDRDRELDASMSPEEIRRIKVYGQTAIPTGKYRISLAPSGTFGNRPWAKQCNGLVPLLENVPGFTGIRIHPMNTAEESLGCIGPGYNTTPGRVNSSTAAYSRIMERLMPAWNAGIPIYITIR